MPYWIVFYGQGQDGKLVDFLISNPFPTIDAAEAKAKNLGAPGPDQITPFHEGKAAIGYRIRDEHDILVCEGGFDA